MQQIKQRKNTELTWGELTNLSNFIKVLFRDEIVTEPHLEQEEEESVETEEDEEEHDHETVGAVAGVLEQAAVKTADEHSIDLKYAFSCYFINWNGFQRRGGIRRGEERRQ